jgi:hypothetical protein
LFKHMSDPCQIAVTTIAIRCNRASTRSASRLARNRCTKHDHHRAVPMRSCVRDNRYKDTEGYPGSAGGIDYLSVAKRDRPMLRPGRCHAIDNARRAVEPLGRHGARSRASVESYNTHDRHRGPCGHPRRPPRAGACRTGRRPGWIAATRRQGGRRGSSSALKTSQRSSARLCTAKLGRRSPAGPVGPCRTAQIGAKLRERELISP